MNAPRGDAGAAARRELRVLSRDDVDFWERNGYVVVRGAVPAANVAAVKDDIAAFVRRHAGADLRDPAQWYTRAEALRDVEKGPGMVELYQTQSLWDNRMHPRIHGAFADLIGTAELHVSIDRVNVKPPVSPDREGQWGQGLGLHWDMDPRRMEARADPRRVVPAPLVQGVLCLTDTPQGGGGFVCVPGFHRQFRDWHRALPEELKGKPFHKQPSLRGLRPVHVDARAGDLIIWSVYLPHGNGANTSGALRMAQFVTMAPPRRGADIAARADAWRTRRQTMGGRASSAWRDFPGPPAELTPLGRRLLGVDAWPRDAPSKM